MSYCRLFKNFSQKRDYSTLTSNITGNNKSFYFFKSFKYVSYSLISSSFILGSIFYYNHRNEDNWQRSLYFWGNLYPIYCHYRIIDILTTNSTQNIRDKKFKKLHIKYKYKIYNMVTKLKGFYIKLGQLGSNRPDVLPQEWIELYRKLEDECPTESFDIIEQIIKDDYNINDIKEIFKYIDPKPLGAASIGQVCIVLINVFLSIMDVIGIE